MPDIAPFRGVRYSNSVPPEAGIAPPYDAIDPAQHRRLLDHHPHNSVRWTLGDDPTRPTADRDEYARRGAMIREWLADGTLVRDAEPALYIHTMEYTAADGARLRYRGLLGAIQVGEWGVTGVLPHEETKPHVVADRLALLSASEVDMGVVHVCLRDGGQLTALLDAAPTQPLFAGHDFAEREHRLERIDDPATIATLAEHLGRFNGIIADGHHRFTTFQEALRQGTLAGADRKLAMVSDLDQPGVVIRPTHRLLVWDGDVPDPAPVAQALAKFLDDGAGNEWTIELAAGEPVAVRSRADGARTLARRLVDAVKALNPAPTIEPFADPEAAVLRLQELGPRALFCRLPAVSKTEFWDRASHGEIFPPKTTWFEPKCPSGLLARFLGGDTG